MWRALKLETLVWAHMYDDTVRYASGTAATLSISRMVAPKIEPEIVFKVKEPVAGADPAAILAGVEWMALGFEIIDCVFPDWQFQPVDFVAAYGLHAALVVGEPQQVTAQNIPALNSSSRCRVMGRLSKRAPDGIRCAVRLCVSENLRE